MLVLYFLVNSIWPIVLKIICRLKNEGVSYILVESTYAEHHFRWCERGCK